LDNKLIAEILIFMVIFIRIYVLDRFKIKSAADKIFALYYLKNHNPLLGYFVIFYIPEIVFIEIYFLKIIDPVLIMIALMEVYLIFRHIFIALKTDDKEDYIDTLIKRMFSTLTYSEYQEVRNELEKVQPFWKLYLTEFLVFFFAIYSIEVGE